MPYVYVCLFGHQLAVCFMLARFKHMFSYRCKPNPDLRSRFGKPEASFRPRGLISFGFIRSHCSPRRTVQAVRSVRSVMPSASAGSIAGDPAKGFLKIPCSWVGSSLPALVRLQIAHCFAPDVLAPAEEVFAKRSLHCYVKNESRPWSFELFEGIEKRN